MKKRQIKSAIKSIYLVKKFLDYYHREACNIFMMHRVVPFEESKLSPNEDMKITPQFLEDFIIRLQENYTFITLDDLNLSLKRGVACNKKKFAILTFDDGYIDNYINAFPIFKRYSIPFTIYLTTGFPDRKAIIWWYIIEDLVLNNEKVELSDGTSYKCTNNIEKTESFLSLRDKIMHLSGNNIEYQLKQLFNK